MCKKVSAPGSEQKSLSTHKHKQYIFIISYHGCAVKIYVNIILVYKFYYEGVGYSIICHKLFKINNLSTYIANNDSS